MIKVKMFGRFRMVQSSHAKNVFPPHNVKLLFSFLLLNRDRPHPRERLAGLLWGKTSMSRSKAYLRKALWQLQELLSSMGDKDGRDILLVDPDWLQINPRANLWLDVEEFERSYDAVRGIKGMALKADECLTLERAVGLYKGSLLEDCYEEFCLLPREYLQGLLLILYDKIMAYCEANQLFENGIQYGVKILEVDPARERTHRRLMRLCYLSGDRTGALRQFSRCQEALHHELNVEPSNLTMTLFNHIANEDTGVPWASPSIEAKDYQERFNEVQGSLFRLKQLLTNVEAIHRRIPNELRILERLLNK